MNKTEILTKIQCAIALLERAKSKVEESSDLSDLSFVLGLLEGADSYTRTLMLFLRK